MNQIITAIKQAMFGTFQDVSNPLVSLLLSGLFSQGDIDITISHKSYIWCFFIIISPWKQWFLPPMTPFPGIFQVQFNNTQQIMGDNVVHLRLVGNRAGM